MEYQKKTPNNLVANSEVLEESANETVEALNGDKPNDENCLNVHMNCNQLQNGSSTDSECDLTKALDDSFSENKVDPLEEEINLESKIEPKTSESCPEIVEEQKSSEESDQLSDTRQTYNAETGFNENMNEENSAEVDNST